MLVVYRHFLGESHPAAGEGPEGVLGGRGGRVDGARSESGAAREQAVIGEVVEGFSQCRRGVHDDLLQRVHRRGARLHCGVPRDLQLAHHLDGTVRGLRDGRRLPRQYGPRGDLRVEGVGLAGGTSRAPVGGELLLSPQSVGQIEGRRQVADLVALAEQVERPAVTRVVDQTRELRIRAVDLATGHHDVEVGTPPEQGS